MYVFLCKQYIILNGENANTNVIIIALSELACPYMLTNDIPRKLINTKENKAENK